ncbi:MAG: TetR/AcrR family transcriptional regulator [Deltaproteobacteria bacterium]|nr:TetR/AcrR family transcriptional regulator [Deltaproteobacteria bacterium]
MPKHLRRVCASGADDDVDSLKERRILKYALHSFATQGYAATGLRAIAAEADVTAPLVNYYFKTKEALYQRVGEMVMNGLVEMLTASWQDDASFTDILRTNLEMHLRFTEEFPEAIGFLFGLLYGPEQGRPAIDLGKYQEIETRVRKAFERATRSGELALHEGVTRADGVELYQSMVMSMVSHNFKAPRFGKPAIEPRVAVRRLNVLLVGLGSLRSGG